MNIFLLIAIPVCLLMGIIILFFLYHHQKQSQNIQFSSFYEQFKEMFIEQRGLLDQRQLESMKILQDAIILSQQDVRTQIYQTLNHSTEQLSGQFDKLLVQVESRLQQIGQQVDQQLKQGFEKTTATFSDVVKRLAIIDEAQKKITELSTNVVSLQDILNDKKARGAFGEIQLSGLIRNLCLKRVLLFNIA